jgi:hypothetical protein
MKSTYKQREESIEDFLERRVRELGGETRKLGYIGRRRATDRLILFPNPNLYATGIHFVVELKKPGLAEDFPRVTDGHEMAQWREHERLRKAGFRVYVIDTKKGVEKVLELELNSLDY